MLANVDIEHSNVNNVKPKREQPTTTQADLWKLTQTEGRFGLINSETMSLIDNINDSLYVGALEYFIKNSFRWVEVPTITKITGACENVDTLYCLNHFGTEAYLAQTGQLYLEAKIPSHKK
ncbi:hypothetical protein HZC32_03025, partial [Candidatus Woesearchaeota archaeon]|nr:hypothetical protein [Candidatus Woesearchaeota archaeon]